MDEISSSPPPKSAVLTAKYHSMYWFGVMGICCELIKIDSSRFYVEGLKGLAAQHMYSMLEKGWE